MKTLLFAGIALTLMGNLAHAREPQSKGYASWYGEELRGRCMANGHPFDPDKLTAASWFYPLGTRVRVTLQEPSLAGHSKPLKTVFVTITDRGPALDLVRSGRIIDLGAAAFKKLAPPELGLVQVNVRPISSVKTHQ